MRTARTVALSGAGALSFAVSGAVLYAALYLAMVGRIVENDWLITSTYWFFGEKAGGFFSVAHRIDRTIRKDYWENHHVSTEGTQD